MDAPALILGSQLSWIFTCLYSPFSLKITPSVFESQMGSNLSCPFSILTQASTFAFPILSFSLWTAFFYRYSQFSKPSTLFLLLYYFILLSFSILSTAWFFLYTILYSHVWNFFLLNFIALDSQFWLHQHLLLFLFSILSASFISHTAKLFSFSLFSILKSGYKFLDAILYSCAQCSFY